MEEIQGFTFYRNYYEIIKYLPTKDRLKLYDAILEYMFDEKEPELKQLLKGIWTNIKMPLDNNKKNIINGKKGGRPKTEEKPKQNPNKTQTITQTKPKVKANNISYFLFLISNNNYKYIHNNNVYNKIIEWLEYKQERKELYKEVGLRNLISEIENNIELYGEDNIIKLISYCMANNYKGIIFEKLKNIKSKKVENVPEWFNKNIKEDVAENQEINKLEERFKKYK